MSGARVLLNLPHRLLSAFLLILAAALTSPLLAQEVGDVEIEVKQLEHLAGTQGPDEEPQNSRFIQAPFTTPGPSGPAVLIDPVETTQREGARMRQLDKMTALTRTFDIATDTEMMVDRLSVRLDACRSPADNAQHGTMAFVQIRDTKRAGEAPVFSGWMFADSPALSALDHPRYDVWVISCTTSPGDAPVASE